jgi:hypothetical protein
MEIRNEAYSYPIWFGFFFKWRVVGGKGSEVILASLAFFFYFCFISFVVCKPQFVFLISFLGDWGT